MGEAWSRAVDKIMGDLPFFLVAGSQWPTFEVLAMFSSHSKKQEASSALGNFQADIHRWNGNHPMSKRFRAYGDLRLSREELAPFGLDDFAWARTQALADMPTHEWYSTLAPWRREQPMRQVFASAMDGILQTQRADSL